jgi:hypothetical protein
VVPQARDACASCPGQEPGAGPGRRKAAKIAVSERAVEAQTEVTHPGWGPVPRKDRGGGGDESSADRDRQTGKDDAASCAGGVRASALSGLHETTIPPR